jgi:hypothetical protein
MLEEEWHMADFTKRFRRSPDDPGTAGGGSVAVGQREQAAQQPPPPDPESRVAPPEAITPDDQTQQLDHTNEQQHYGGAAASRPGDNDGDGVPDRQESEGGGVAQRTKDHVRGDHDHDGVKDRDESGGHRGVMDRVRDRDNDGVRDRDERRDRDRDERASGVTAARDVRARQRDEFGGFNWGSAFFGWLVAIGLGALLTAAISGAGAAIGLTDSGVQNSAENNAETVTVAGGILLLLVAMVAYYCGGYVAGRMSRFDGARQGLGVWVFGLLATVAIAAAGWIFGDEYNLLDRLDLPRIPIDAGDLTTGGIIALAAIVLGTLIAAMSGGKVGQRYHNKIDRHGFGESRL